jgi:hypothetical protein
MHEQKTVESRTKIIPIAIAVLLVSVLASQLQSVNASSKSPYESGRDHGCDDADISDPDNRYINQPEKGPSFHTNEFMRGYNDGYDECSNSNSSGNNDAQSDDFGGNDRQSNGEGRVNWEQLCIKYGDRIGISSDRCDQYAHGTQLTQDGEDFLVCNLIARVGPTLLGLDIVGIGVGGILAELC